MIWMFCFLLYLTFLRYFCGLLMYLIMANQVITFLIKTMTFIVHFNVIVLGIFVTPLQEVHSCQPFFVHTGTVITCTLMRPCLVSLKCFFFKCINGAHNLLALSHDYSAFTIQ